MSKDTSDKYQLHKTSDLTTMKSALKIGGTKDCESRGFCLDGFKSTYGLQFS